MGQLRKEFTDLGFDLLGLNNIFYLVGASTGPEEPGDPCQGGQCTVSCTNGCSSCRPGNK